MTSIAIACGTLLIIIGLLGYINSIMTAHASLTALIPAAFGVVIVGLGLGARKFESARRHLMHAAVLVALIGFALTAGRLAMKFGELSYSAAVVSQVSMALVCLLFVILAIRSFIDARRSRTAE